MCFFSLTRNIVKSILVFLLVLPLFCYAQHTRIDSLISEIQKANREEVLQDIFEGVETINSLSSMETKKVELTNNSAPTEAYVNLNTVSVIIRNLISNAIKFGSENTKVMLNTQMQGNKVVMTIRDGGRGMTDKREKGFGLGLKLSYEFARLNQGDISVETETNKGNYLFALVASNTRDI